MVLIKLIIIANFAFSTSIETIDCNMELESTICFDAENWTSEEGGIYYAKVCDNTSCSKAWFDAHDGMGTCSVGSEL
ncbi:MAG: hypothetical protein ACJAS3_001104 [Roseivirga sp.]|jgi:hypothetical protein